MKGLLWNPKAWSKCHFEGVYDRTYRLLFWIKIIVCQIMGKPRPHSIDPDILMSQFAELGRADGQWCFIPFHPWIPIENLTQQ